MRILIVLFTVITLLGPGCIRPYKVDIQQGNVIDAEQIAQLNTGMTRREVQYILGTPLVEDPFHANRWDYFYSLKEGRSKKRQQQIITVVFESDQLVRIEGVPETTEVRVTKTEFPEQGEKVKEEGFFKRLFNKRKKDSES